MPVKLFRLMSAFVAVALLGACAGGEFGTKDGDGATVVESGSSSGSATSTGTGATSTGTGSGIGLGGSVLDDPTNPLSNRTLYFEYDRSELRPEDQAVVEAHAMYLADNPSASITLEGHADERGTREYNVGLGEQRAQAVRRMMGLLGASAQQIRLISYGEERPATDGHDESSWQYNRRVEIIYRTR